MHEEPGRAGAGLVLRFLPRAEMRGEGVRLRRDTSAGGTICSFMRTRRMSGRGSRENRRKRTCRSGAEGERRPAEKEREKLQVLKTTSATNTWTR